VRLLPNSSRLSFGSEPLLPLPAAYFGGFRRASESPGAQLWQGSNAKVFPAPVRERLRLQRIRPSTMVLGCRCSCAQADGASSTREFSRNSLARGVKGNFDGHKAGAPADDFSTSTAGVLEIELHGIFKTFGGHTSPSRSGPSRICSVPTKCGRRRASLFLGQHDDLEPSRKPLEHWRCLCKS